jgi:putative toxin-antitoxin system antitoxin component (TIGR02293 family)
LGFRQKELADFLHVDASTITRWKKNETEIGILRAKIILDIDEIIAKGVRIFGSEADFKDWLASLNYSLGDQRPIELLKDPYGTEAVDEALEAISWGVYL